MSRVTIQGTVGRAQLNGYDFRRTGRAQRATARSEE